MSGNKCEPCDLHRIKSSETLCDSHPPPPPSRAERLDPTNLGLTNAALCGTIIVVGLLQVIKHLQSRGSSAVGGVGHRLKFGAPFFMPSKLRLSGCRFFSNGASEKAFLSNSAVDKVFLLNCCGAHRLRLFSAPCLFALPPCGD